MAVLSLSLVWSPSGNNTVMTYCHCPAGTVCFVFREEQWLQKSLTLLYVGKNRLKPNQGFHLPPDRTPRYLNPTWSWDTVNVERRLHCLMYMCVLPVCSFCFVYSRQWPYQGRAGGGLVWGHTSLVTCDFCAYQIAGFTSETNQRSPLGKNGPSVSR